jgi:hypothetical protein
MRIAIPALVDPAASIVIRTPSHGPFSLRLIDCAEGISKRVIALGHASVGRHDVSHDIPVHKIARSLYDGFEVNAEVPIDVVTEILDALIAARLAKVVA